MIFNNILVVCVGNICRSPMAEALLADALADKAGVSVSSAGIAALIGEPADPMAQSVLSELGLDLSSHRAQQLTPELTRAADLILVMESGHRRAVESIDRSVRGKTYRWGEWGGFDVPDPYRRPREAFEQSLALIRQGLEDWLPKLKG